MIITSGNFNFLQFLNVNIVFRPRWSLIHIVPIKDIYIWTLILDSDRHLGSYSHLGTQSLPLCVIYRIWTWPPVWWGCLARPTRSSVYWRRCSWPGLAAVGCCYPPVPWSAASGPRCLVPSSEWLLGSSPTLSSGGQGHSLMFGQGHWPGYWNMKKLNKMIMTSIFSV